MLHSSKDFLKLFTLLKFCDIIFNIIPYGYHCFGKKVLPNV